MGGTLDAAVPLMPQQWTNVRHMLEPVHKKIGGTDFTTISKHSKPITELFSRIWCTRSPCLAGVTDEIQQHLWQHDTLHCKLVGCAEYVLMRSGTVRAKFSSGRSPAPLYSEISPGQSERCHRLKGESCSKGQTGRDDLLLL